MSQSNDNTIEHLKNVLSQEEALAYGYVATLLAIEIMQDENISANEAIQQANDYLCEFPIDWYVILATYSQEGAKLKPIAIKLAEEWNNNRNSE